MSKSARMRVGVARAAVFSVQVWVGRLSSHEEDEYAMAP